MEINERRRETMANGTDGVEDADAADAIDAAGSDAGRDTRDTRSAAGTVGAKRPTDMLALLLAAQDDQSVEYPPNQVRDEVATFLIAGHETTALSLTYTLSLLSWHPAARERVRTEAKAVFGSGENASTPGYEHVDDLTYTDRTYREALRLYPPAWATFRQASAEVRLGNFRVEEGSAVVLPQWSIQRDRRYFERPSKFDPDRWRRRNPNAVPAYFPFASGPHACIERAFALSGATLALSRLTQEFDVSVPKEALDDLRPTPTLRPAGEVGAAIRRAR